MHSHTDVAESASQLGVSLLVMHLAELAAAAQQAFSHEDVMRSTPASQTAWRLCAMQFQAHTALLADHKALLCRSWTGFSVPSSSCSRTRSRRTSCQSSPACWRRPASPALGRCWPRAPRPRPASSACSRQGWLPSRPACDAQGPWKFLLDRPCDRRLLPGETGWRAQCQECTCHSRSPGVPSALGLQTSRLPALKASILCLTDKRHDFWR